jgi:hypothetical protein
MNIKRKPRTKLKNKIDLSKPVTIETLGTKDDPCFGKHYDIKAPECQSCGDCELCAIVTGQNNHIKRLEKEKSNAFKDLEPIKMADLKEVRKKMKLRVKELCSRDGYDEKKLVADLSASYSKFGYSQIKVRAFLSKLAGKNLITIKNGTIKWKNTQ